MTSGMRHFVLREGKRYIPDIDQLEIDITWECNLHCQNCDRSCSQAPTTDRMSVDQIARFLEQSKESSKRWRRLTVMGGEPTIHPNVSEILDLLLEYKSYSAPDVEIILASNGYAHHARQLLMQVPPGISVRNGRKASPRIETFEPFNVAPIDIPAIADADFADGCWITAACGLGLNRHGFYPCGVAGGIARVFGLDIALQARPSDAETLRSALDQACRYCGHFLRGEYVPKERRVRLVGEPMSPTWKRAYARLPGHQLPKF
jgi:hypothetical protein